MSQSTSIARRPASTSKISSVGIEAERLEGLVIIRLEPRWITSSLMSSSRFSRKARALSRSDGLDRVDDLEVEDLDHVDECRRAARPGRSCGAARRGSGYAARA